MRLSKKYFFWCFLVLGSCNFNPDKSVTPAWEMDFIGPIVKADMNIQNIAQLGNLHVSESLNASQLGAPSPGIKAPIPPFPSPTLSYSLSLTSAFKSINLTSGNFYFRITNDLQVDIKAGTKILISDASGNIINQTLPKIDSVSTYTSPITNMANKNIGSALQLDIQNFASDGRTDSVMIDASRKLTIDIFLDNVKVNSITLSNANSFAIADTSDFRITGTGIKSTSVAGTFTTFVTNSLPLRFNMQVYLLDESKTTILDSLFPSTFQVDLATGLIPKESQIATVVNNTKLDNLNKAYFAYTKMALVTPPNATIANNLLLKTQIVGDLQIKLSK